MARHVCWAVVMVIPLIILHLFEQVRWPPGCAHQSRCFGLLLVEIDMMGESAQLDSKEYVRSISVFHDLTWTGWDMTPFVELSLSLSRRLRSAASSAPRPTNSMSDPPQSHKPPTVFLGEGQGGEKPG